MILLAKVIGPGGEPRLRPRRPICVGRIDPTVTTAACRGMKIDVEQALAFAVAHGLLRRVNSRPSLGRLPLAGVRIVEISSFVAVPWPG